MAKKAKKVAKKVTKKVKKNAVKRFQERIYETDDLILPGLELATPCPITINILKDTVELYVGQRSWEWERETEVFLGSTNLQQVPTIDTVLLDPTTDTASQDLEMTEEGSSNIPVPYEDGSNNIPEITEDGSGNIPSVELPDDGQDNG